ncbi:plexin-C1 [Narcine bancroftii]|uniref:plexin-C1 n=1 Tax=Narcine bancroftii TaxID=1343680 RepID=UPI003831FD51
MAMHPSRCLRLCPLLFATLLASDTDPSYRFETDTNNIAMSVSGGGRVYVATDNFLYQFNRSLALEMWARTGPRVDGPCVERDKCCVPWEKTTNVNRILAVEEHQFLLTCGTVRIGACEVRQLSNISHFEADKTGRVAAQDPRASTVAFIVEFEKRSYIVTAVTGTGEGSRFIPESCKGNTSYYGILKTEVSPRSLELPENFLIVDTDDGKPSVHFNDLVEYQFIQGFHKGNNIYISLTTNTSGPLVLVANLPSLKPYALVNVSCRLAGNGALQVLSSALLSTSKPQSFLAIVFSRPKQPQYNALCVYDLDKIKERRNNTLDIKPLFNYPGLLSVSATLVHNWTVVFLGTEDGQLFKLVLDKNMKVIRPSILIELKDESPIRHSIMFDKMDSNYIYLLTMRMVRRLKVSNCSQYRSCENCLSAQDPNCGWCIHLQRCSFWDECQEENLINIANPDSCPKVTFRPLAIDNTLKEKMHFTVTSEGRFSNLTRQNAKCEMRNAKNNEPICQANYNSQCICKLSEEIFSRLYSHTDPILIEASIKLTSLRIVTRAKLNNCFKITTSYTNNPCSECVNSGCHWSAVDHRCSPACNGNTIQACPHITRAEQVSNTDLHIFLKDAELLNNSSLKCIFDKFESNATWISSSTIQCPRPPYDEERRVILVNLAHASNLKYFIDNPNNITVFSCDVQKPDCVFCTPERICTETIVTGINPERVSKYGHSNLTIVGSGLNVGLNAKLHVNGMVDHISNKTNKCTIENSTFVECVLPDAIHGKKSVCLLYDFEKTCTANRTALLEYVINSYVTEIHPAVSWVRGGRRMMISGKNLDVVQEMKISLTEDQESWTKCINNNRTWICESPSIRNGTPGNYSVSFLIYGSAQRVPLMYEENPIFYTFTKIIDDEQLLITVTRKEDNLQLSKDEIKIVIVQDEDHSIECNITELTEDKIKCVQNILNISILKIEVKIGKHIDVLFNSTTKKSYHIWLAMIPIVMTILIFIFYLASHQRKKQFSQKLEVQMKLLESQLRAQIREGFVELQTEGSDVYLMNDYNSIPFLDYKHFAARTFFPESANESAETNFVKDLIVTTPQDTQESDKLDGFDALYNLLNNEQFLVTSIHALERQKDFSIKDRCRFASFLTIAFHSNLIYLTIVLDQLLKDLMDQSTVQPKLLLRSTETVVEKLLTNWVSLCMYGFLRESVGEALFKLVSAIKQRINQGPVDAITGKALYTLNEDWLLWQVNDFETLKLDVSFQLNIEDDQDNNSSFEVEVLDCDTIGQVKEKIFETFFSKYGYSQRFQMEDIDLVLIKKEARQRLQDLDQTTQVLEDGMKKLNTVGHYHITNGASVIVMRRGSIPVTLGIDSPSNLCHLISPHSTFGDPLKPGQGKKKFKVKEMYLTKLLSSKVALQSFVENLFRSIWNTQNGKSPIAIRHIFDILQVHAYNKKITDPDVLHIWKTNSLPLRFWINVIKNPQLVFDIEKTPHLDGCLSVVAQAFMDSFSLSSQHLGKHSPTNKVLYARDVLKYKEEVRSYYKQIGDLGSVKEEELENFLLEESKKHQNEFKEKDAMVKLGKYIQKYSVQVENQLESNGLQDLREGVAQIREYFLQKSSCSWE